MILNLNLNLKLLNKFQIYHILNHLFHYMHCVGAWGVSGGGGGGGRHFLVVNCQK